MKFTLSWLRSHLDTEASLQAITDTLSGIGLEVEKIQDPGAALAPFRTARIIEAVPHPNADRLRVCRVSVGEAEVSVVCGAPNARTGLHVVFAPPGAVIPGSGITLKVGEIRGVSSAGMLVSARELGLGEEHDGIIELPDGAPVGQPYAAWAGLDDPVIEIGVTPNRGDALGVRGIARDLAAAGLGVLKPWEAAPVPAGFASPHQWRIEWPEACPWVLGRSIRGVRNGASPEWLRRRLTAIGLRPISALVDITNFFTFDLGRPLHVFDADRIEGRTLTLRRGREEGFRALNGRDLRPGPQDLVIEDAAGVCSLAGIMGGERTATGESTTHVVLECALFDPVCVALAGRRHALASDARARFERGVDQALPPAALEAATRMIIDLCGGEAGSVVEAGAAPHWQRVASLRLERLRGLGGAEISPDEARGILARLGFEPAGDGDSDAVLRVQVPAWRNDVAGSREGDGGGPDRLGLDQSPGLAPDLARVAAEGAAAMAPECDLLEEVLRIHGLDRIEAVSLPDRSVVPAPALSPRQARTALARRCLASEGLTECVTFSFMARAQAEWFGAAPASLRLNNPIAADLDQMRPTPLATLAMAAARNLARGARRADLFEIGPGFGAQGQMLMAAGLRAGPPPRHWLDGAAGAAGRAAPDQAAMVAKADLWRLLAELEVPLEALSVTEDAPGHYHPGQSATVRQGPHTVLGRFGALHPTLIDRLGLVAPVCAFELLIDALGEPRRRKRALPELSPLQPVSRDFAFIVPEDMPAERVLRAARGAARGVIAEVCLFDVYRSEALPPGHVSLGVEVVFQPRGATLTDQEIENLCQAVVQAVGKATGAQLR